MNKKSLIPLALVILILILLYAFGVDHSKIKTLTQENLESILSDDGYVIVYYGDETDDINDLLNSFTELGKIDVYYCDLSLDDLNANLKEDSLSTESLDIFVLYNNGKAQIVFDNQQTVAYYDEQINYYFYGIIPSSEISYLVPADADSLISLINSKKNTIIVLGETSCSYCLKYLPVINNIAKEYELSVYYIDSDEYDSDEYDKIISMDLTIPGECTSSGNDEKLSNVKSRPMTLVTKSNKVIGCIKGYYKEEIVVNKFKNLGLIKE